MNPAQEQREKGLAFRRELYRDHPQAEAFQRAKSRWMKGLMLYCLIHMLLRAVLLGRQGAAPWALVLGAGMGLGMNLIFLGAGLGPRRKLAWVLYLWGFYQLYQLAASLWEGALRSIWQAGQLTPGALLRFFWGYVSAFPLAPLSVGHDLMSLLYLVLLFGTALWLTAVPRNRRLAAEAEPLEEQWRAYVMAQSKQSIR